MNNQMEPLALGRDMQLPEILAAYDQSKFEDPQRIEEIEKAISSAVHTQLTPLFKVEKKDEYACNCEALHGEAHKGYCKALLKPKHEWMDKDMQKWYRENRGTFFRAYETPYGEIDLDDLRRRDLVYLIFRYCQPLTGCKPA